MDNTYELFAKIIEAKGITPYRIAKDTGLTTVLFTDWKKGKSKPKFPKLKIIVDHLGGSVGYLQGMESKQQEILDIIDNQFDTESETEISLSEQEKTLIKLFRDTTEEGRCRIIQAVLNVHDDIEKKRTDEITESIG